MAERWSIDLTQAQRHADAARAAPSLPKALWAEVFARPAPPSAPDADEDLYGGFIGNEDRRRLERLRGMSPESLAQQSPQFDDARLEELLFRYRARNFEATLTPAEHERWEAHRAARLHEGQGGALTLSAFFERIDALSEDADERGEAILGALYDYAEQIAPAAD